MPILPIIDLLILMGWTSLFGAFALKGIHISTSYRPTLFGLGPFDMVVMGGVFLLFSLALAARTWVKVHEGQTQAATARAAATLDSYALMLAEANGNDGPARSAAGSGWEVGAYRPGVAGDFGARAIFPSDAA